MKHSALKHMLDLKIAYKNTLPQKIADIRTAWQHLLVYDWSPICLNQFWQATDSLILSLQLHGYHALCKQLNQVKLTIEQAGLSKPDESVLKELTSCIQNLNCATTQ